MSLNTKLLVCISPFALLFQWGQLQTVFADDNLVLKVVGGGVPPNPGLGKEEGDMDVDPDSTGVGLSFVL